MGCTYNYHRHGFTLVEISIVMIIIGLLVGGTFGGMQLIENMRVNRSIQDLKAIESAALTFKDTYGRLPGDMTNTASRLPNCTVAPCATGGNGNRIIGTSALGSGAIAAADENFTFWHHLQAADLLSLHYNNTANMSGGQGQPRTPFGDVFRISNWDNLDVSPCSSVEFTGTVAGMTSTESAAYFMDSATTCLQNSSIDRKIDDGLSDNGRYVMWRGCWTGTSCQRTYRASGSGVPIYDLKGF